jgi:hypothetical protein
MVCTQALDEQGVFSCHDYSTTRSSQQKAMWSLAMAVTPVQGLLHLLPFVVMVFPPRHPLKLARTIMN